MPVSRCAAHFVHYPSTREKRIATINAKKQAKIVVPDPNSLAERRKRHRAALAALRDNHLHKSA